MLRHLLLARHFLWPLFALELLCGWQPWMVILSLGIVLTWPTWMFSRSQNAGWFVVMLGGLLNKVCIIANNGYMPVSGDIIKEASGKHVPLSSSHVLVGLADNYGGASIGDFIAFFGLLAVLSIWTIRKIKGHHALSK
jgi:hypothetical protein